MGNPLVPWGDELVYSTSLNIKGVHPHDPSSPETLVDPVLPSGGVYIGSIGASATDI